MIDALNRIIGPLHRRVVNMLARGIVQLVDDASKLQALQLVTGSEDETHENVERFQQYGFSSRPAPGAEAIVLFLGGRRDHGVVVAVDDRRYRKKNLAEGEVAIYVSAGQSILLKADGTIEIGGGTMQPAALGQDVRDELDDIRAKLATHKHSGVVVGNAVSGVWDQVLSAAKTIKSATVKVKT